MPDSRRGFGYGAAAYLLWGLFPLYWPLLEPASATEILAHRITWSLITMAVVVVLVGRTGQLVRIWHDRRSRTLLAGAAVVITANWGTYIWGVNHHRVIETSLGYFINPLVTVVLGVVVLGERLRRWQWAALGLATAAVVLLTVEYGHPPWVALTLAFSFGCYGLLKKKAAVDAVESLTFETAVLTPVAVGYLLLLAVTGRSHFVGEGPLHVVLLMLTGIVTAIPLLFFGAAAVRIPLTTIGLLQYLAPSLQFLLGVTLLGEHMSRARWVGFSLVWLALVVFTIESLRHRRRELQAAAEASAI